MPIVVNCPACGTPASIEPAHYGKKLRCANQSCRQMFRVGADGKVKVEGGTESRKLAKQPMMTGTSSGIEEADWLSAPPPKAGEPVPAAGYAAEAVEVVEAVEDEDEGGHVVGDYDYGRRKNRFLLIFIFFMVLVIAGSAGAFYFYRANVGRQLETTKKEFLDSMSKQRWDEAIEKGTFYRSKIGEGSEAREIDFQIAWCRVQQAAAPGQFSEPAQLGAHIKKAVEELSQFNKTRREERGFADLHKDIYETSFRIVKLGAEQIDKQPVPDPDALQSLRDAREVMKEFQKDYPDADQAATMAKEAETKFNTAADAVSASNAKINWTGKYDDVIKRENVPGIDALQSDYAQMIKSFGRLAQDGDLAAKMKNLRDVEPQWVRFSNREDTPVQPNLSFGTNLRICPPVKTPEGVADDNATVLAMARGTLYGLSARTGKDRWSLRVGQDLQFLPPQISLGGNQPDLAFVVTMERTEKEGDVAMLSSMNIQSGERLWARKLPGVCPAGPVLMGTRLAVPVRETVAIVEAGSGKLNGFFTLAGYDLAIPPAWDKPRNRLFVPVDRRRIFVLDLAKNACVGVIYTEHQAGGLKGAPLIIDDVLIACVASGAGSGSTRVLAYDIKSSTLDQIASYDLPGHASTAPFVDGDTVGVVTDRGVLSLFGVGTRGAPPGSKGSTPFFQIMKPQALKLHANNEVKGDPPTTRGQIAHVVLSDWWVFSQDLLIRNVFDPYRGQLNVSPVGALALGTPLHGSFVTADGRLLVAVTQPKNQAQIIASGIDCVTGKVVWQTQLGTVASQEPVSLGENVAMLDHGGAVFLVSATEVAADVSWQVCGHWPALPLAAASHKLVQTPDGKSVISLSFAPERDRLVVRKIDVAGRAAQTKEFPLAVAPQGTPVAQDDGTLLAPCKDGNIYQFNFQNGTTSLLFAWRDSTPLPGAAGHLLMPSANLLLATNGTAKILRWDRSPQGSWRKAMMDMELPARAAGPLCLLPNQMIAVGDEAQTLHCLTIGGLSSPRQWNVGGMITKGPFRVGEKGVGCIVDGKKAWWINSPDDEQPKLFVADAIIGAGATIGSDLVLATLKRSTSGNMLARFDWLELDSGRPQQGETLAVGLAPASGPVVLGKDRIFAPLTDGTVRILSKPGEARTAANP